MNRYCHYLLYKYSCLLLIPILGISILLIIWGIKENNFISTTEYAFPEKTISYNLNVSNHCQIIESDTLIYSSCDSGENTNQDRCSIMNSCDRSFSNYYRCGLCAKYDTGPMCRNAIRYNFTWHKGCSKNTYQYNWCKNAMIRDLCIETTELNRHDSLTFRCKHYPKDGIATCNTRCDYDTSLLKCFPEDVNCKRYFQNVCDFTKNYYYEINTRYGFIQEGLIHYTHKSTTKRCSLNHTECVTKEMNNNKTTTIYYDKNNPFTIIYSSLDVPTDYTECNLRTVTGLMFFLLSTVITIRIFEKTKDHSEFLINQQREEISKLNQSLLESELRPSNLGGILFEQSRIHFENTRAKIE
ncbi:MAG: hypothetical protein Harvfovirus22_21 [Harvfovirus sp.]|uniref:Uncharacterized protein n=1 Tax=Harvfovirus sp. TaxID=2487768 RepID=A0A3G5A1Z1_9VIRU|nr:MAG: hypothetical protein Harvfovirus22_21 [Harvfovirus sp.]